MKIFWSWQSDTHGKTGRHFVRQCLADAIEALSQPEDIEEPSEREVKEAMHLDHDRKGVPGSPDLMREIFKKIDAAVLVVADVTPVSTIPARADGEPEKRNMNPNVAIEVGYALKALSDYNILMVLNTYYGGREFVPFDLAQKGGPIMYRLRPDADTQTIKVEAKRLQATLVEALRPYMKAAAVTARPQFRETPAGASAAVYFDDNEVLAVVGEADDAVEFQYETTRGFYLRVMPTRPLARPFTKVELVKAIERMSLRPMFKQTIGMYRSNRFGAIAYVARSINGSVIQASSQVFCNGEVWGFAPWALIDNEHGKIIPTAALEREYRTVLPKYLGLMGALGIPAPYSVEAGAVGLLGHELICDDLADERYGPFHDDELKWSATIDNANSATVDAGLLRFFESLFVLSGYARPANLYGFPGSA